MIKYVLVLCMMSLVIGVKAQIQIDFVSINGKMWSEKNLTITTFRTGMKFEMQQLVRNGLNAFNMVFLPIAIIKMTRFMVKPMVGFIIGLPLPIQED